MGTTRYCMNWTQADTPIKKFAVIVAMMIFATAGIVFADYIQDAPKRVKAADWAKMETITVELTEFAYSPSTINLQAGIPYKLIIKNNGTVKHYFTAGDFFKTIATRKIQSTDGEIKAPYFSAIEIFPGRTLDLYFIPVTKGVYNLHCTIEGHKEQGMFGTIEIK